MFQFLIIPIVLYFFYSWHKANPARVIPIKKHKHSRRRNCQNNHRKYDDYIEEDCFFEDDDWRSDPAYSIMSGNYYHND